MSTKKMRGKCVIPRAFRNPRAFFRWGKMKWRERVRALEKELGGPIESC